MLSSFSAVGKSNFSDDGKITEWRLNYDGGGIFEKTEHKNNSLSSTANNKNYTLSYENFSINDIKI